MPQTPYARTRRGSGNILYNEVDVHFGSQEEKAAFVCRLKRVREHLSPEDRPPLDNYMMTNTFFDPALKEDNLRTLESSA